MNHYQHLSATPPGFAPRRTNWYGTVSDALEARKDRCNRIYQVLLIEAGPVGNDMVDRLWVEAQSVVASGRDLS